jgi:hypothetical protein
MPHLGSILEAFLQVRKTEVSPLDASTQGEDVSMWGYVLEEVEFGVI